MRKNNILGVLFWALFCPTVVAEVINHVPSSSPGSPIVVTANEEYTFSGISVEDNEGSQQQLRVELSTSYGELQVSDYSRSVMITGNGTTSITISGPANHVRNILDSLIYQAPIPGTMDTLIITSQDIKGLGMDTDYVYLMTPSEEMPPPP